MNGAKTSNATNIGQSTTGLASELKPNINEKQSKSQAPKTVAQARAHWDVCVAFSLNDTLNHMTFEHTSAHLHVQSALSCACAVSVSISP